MKSKVKGKEKSNPMPLSLIPYPGCGTYGYYVNIAASSWSGAKNMDVPPISVSNMTEAFGNTTFYFPPVCKHFVFEASTKWAESVRYTGRFDGKHLMINATFVRAEGSLTLSFLFRNGIMCPKNTKDYLQTKTSTFYKYVVDCAMSCLRLDPKRREETREYYINQGTPTMWISTLCGDFNINTSFAAETLCASICMRDFLDLFKTLSTYDYARELGLIPDGIISPGLGMSKEIIYAVEAECSKHATALSGLELDMFDSCKYRGSVISFFCMTPKVLGARGAYQLVDTAHPSNDEIDLDYVTKHAANNYFYVDSHGAPMESVGTDAEAQAQWVCYATGVRADSVGQPDLYGIYFKDNGSWRFLRFLPLINIPELLKESGVEFDKNLWAELILPSYHHSGKGVKPADNNEQGKGTYTSVARHYDCSENLYEVVADNFNIKSVADANIFIDSFIRLLRRRNVPWDYNKIYNTGLLAKNGNYIYLMIPSLYGNRRFIQPCVISDFASIEEPPFVPAKEQRYLMLSGDREIIVDLRSFEHALEERTDRLPDSVKEMSFHKLSDYVVKSVHRANIVMKSNPFYAQPMWSESDDKIYHFIPLYGETVTDDDLLGALLIKRGRVATLYSVDMARTYSLFIQTPPAQWLCELYK